MQVIEENGMEDIYVANQGINHNTKKFTFHSTNINLQTKKMKYGRVPNLHHMIQLLIQFLWKKNCKS